MKARVICFESYRRDRERQVEKRPVQAVLPMREAADGSLGNRQVAHREAMLAHLTRKGVAR